MAGMFSKLVYNNIRPTDEEVQSLDLEMIDGFQLKEAESEFPPKIAADCFDKRPAVDVQSQVDVDIQDFEEFSTVPPTEILKKAGLTTDASTFHLTKKQKIIRFDPPTVEEQVCQKTPSFISTRIVSTQKTASSGSEHVHAEKTTQLSSLKSVCQDNSDEKWDDIKLFLQSYDVEECSEDNATVILDALVEFVVNHNSDNINAGTSTTVHDVEGVSADFGPTTLECLVAAVENQKPNNDNVETSNMQLDAILKVIAAPVDDVPIEVVPPAESIVNQHDISDSKLPLDFSDAVVAAHQAAKTPTKIFKRIRTRSKVFNSLYTTEYASGSKVIEDQIEEQKQQFAFDGFLISDTISSSVIEEFKQWVEEGLLKFHAKKYYEDDTDTVLTTQQDYAESVRVALIEEAITHIINGYCMPSGLSWNQVDEVDCGVFVAGYAEYLSEEMNVPSDGFEEEYHRMHYATLLRKYDIEKAKKGYVSENLQDQNVFQRMSKYTKYLKDVVTNKTKIGDIEMVALTEECSSVVMRKMPKKLKDPGVSASPYKLMKVMWSIL
ncbi:hypothetical protein T459_02866 [Capsicum annuum]|uniref:Ubiquitin-like protease family profile domain-containing protein n=1 Tax=Capsicum annuum TaxID=4072 RepID=A0A2G3AL75_CAPAN|nr:hypothetical protein FXO37_20128 [Capsicum annuum]PHT94984.1 hypothetical protein T459_02866 [Capsicum annuum]